MEVPSLAGWLGGRAERDAGFEMRSIIGGLLLQERDIGSIGLGDLHHVTKHAPSIAESRAIFFAWTVAKHVRSNAVVIATGAAVRLSIPPALRQSRPAQPGSP